MTTHAHVAAVLQQAKTDFENAVKGIKRHAPFYALLTEINERYQEEHNKSVSVTLSAYHVIVSIYLGREQSFKDTAPFLDPFVGVAGWKARSQNDGNSVDHIFTHVDENNNRTNVYVYVYPHDYSSNCERVEVGTQPVYEWRCKDREVVYPE